MVESYNFTGTVWELFDISVTLIDSFTLADTFVEPPEPGTMGSQVISRLTGLWIPGVVLTEANDTHRRFLSNKEIVAMGLIDDLTLNAQFDHDKAQAIDGSGGGGGGGDDITDHYSDIESATYYYYGYNRNATWEFLRNQQANINLETKATPSLNPLIVDLNDAIANRVTLIYA